MEYVFTHVWQSFFPFLHSRPTAPPSFQTWLHEAGSKSSSCFFSLFKIYASVHIFHIFLHPVNWIIPWHFTSLFVLMCYSNLLALNLWDGSISLWQSTYFSPHLHSCCPSLAMWRINNVEDRQLTRHTSPLNSYTRSQIIIPCRMCRTCHWKCIFFIANGKVWGSQIDCRVNFHIQLPSLTVGQLTKMLQLYKWWNFFIIFAK